MLEEPNKRCCTFFSVATHQIYTGGLVVSESWYFIKRDRLPFPKF